MLLFADSASTMKAHSAKMLTLAIASLISPAEAAVTCSSSSPQCCWVVRIWQLLGKTTSVSSTSSTACCSPGIPGVSCSGSTVTKINWTKFRLSGNFPSEFGKLTSLTDLRLGSNQLSGPIPDTIGNLRNLLVLQLNANQLSGSIPDSIGNLVNLKQLVLLGNQLTGIPATIGNLGSLKILHLQNNQFSGPIPATIGSLRTLKELNLARNGFTGSIPFQIGNLQELTTLLLYSNQLSGAVPNLSKLTLVTKLFLHNNQLTSLPGIQSLNNLRELTLQDNPDLQATLTPFCTTVVDALNTSVTICGCSAGVSPPVAFPPPGTPDACLATGLATSLRKRVLAFSQVVGSYKFTCHVDSNRNPFQDCLNAMAYICNPTYMAGSITRINDCKNGVNSMAGQMNSHWQLVRKECGQWPWNGITGSVTSTGCASANNALQQNAFYITSDGGKIRVPAALTESVSKGLWSNSALKG